MAEPRICEVDGCGKAARGSGLLCNAHRIRQWRHGDPTAGSYGRTRRKDWPDTCTVVNCSKPPRTRGLCSAHYARESRNGDPTAGRVSRGSIEKFIQDVALAHDSVECLPWPFARNPAGYAIQSTHKGRLSGIVSRHICILAHGEPPSATHVAAHSCGNGHLGCVNPKHLRWATSKENAYDALLHGTRRYRTVLSVGDVEEIRSPSSRLVTLSTLARKYGVSMSHISGIINGRSRKHG